MFTFHRAWRYGYATPCSSVPYHRPDRERLKSHAFSWHTGPMFGVRRPLRYLAWKLELTDEQTRQLVEVLDRLKTAYAQAKLDRDRSTSDIAAVFAGESFAADRMEAALDARTASTRALNTELGVAIRRIFDVLSEAQRQEFAYLLRSGGFTL